MFCVSLKVEAVAGHPDTIGLLGIVRIALAADDAPPQVQVNDRDVLALAETLEAENLILMPAWANLYLAADFLIQAGSAMYLIKPLVKRLWLPSHALGDAQRIVDAVRFPSKQVA